MPELKARELRELTLQELEEKLKQNTYDIVGFTIRNIDSCIYFNNEFYLPNIRNLIKIVRYSMNLPKSNYGYFWEELNQ